MQIPPILTKSWNPGWRTCAMVVLAAFAVLTTAIALQMPYPSTFDELAHVSVARAQYEHPAPFADAARYRMLSRDDPTRWTAAGNYINHPPLYYMAIGQILRVTSDVLVLRLANVALALAALAIGLWAGARYLAGNGDRAVFALLIACFPKAPLIGGIVNNDNLANVAAAIVFAGLTSAGGGAWLLGLGLALAGWTKLTALVSLGAAVIVARGWSLVRGRSPWRCADLWLIALGAAIGALPYLVTYARTGHLLYVNEAVYGAALADRPQIDIWGYAAFFLGTLANKWPAAEYQVPVAVSALLALTPIALAMVGSRADQRVGAIGWPFLAALGVTLVIHFWFGWSAFERIGDQTIAQSRYYAVLWPGIALAAASGLRVLARRSRPVAMLAVLMILIPTVPGGAVVALL
ncbi:hypothetical protein EJC47_12350 [Sphingomonas sp. TF3]|uniref:hypothetical protein n=1 Tax=Sphingomonas sp. TF3 TaxID=2495580 RepID=UPI000F87DE32|nr:hypothetical protein [Sphingomonas sp. TF3]RUN76170.1 hypothetical protein EJC47_12350 [Sphingomonas sp. TF3]